uniref:Uncharacterized protein n=1 Tax=Arundo donax TaxID=35708 RepID=A0A0A9CAJ8_ARUDO
MTFFFCNLMRDRTLGCMTLIPKGLFSPLTNVCTFSVSNNRGFTPMQGAWLSFFSHQQ